MTISDSTPIQFWDYTDETFNEQQPICGLTPDCFCLPVNCTDIIPFQVSDENISALELVVFDTDSEEIATEDFTEVDDGVFSLEITSEDLSPSICQKVNFRLKASKEFINEEFTTDISSWEQFGTGISWDWFDDGGDGSARGGTIAAPLTNSKYFRQPISIKSPANGGLSFLVDFEINTSVTQVGTVYIKFYGFSGATITELAQVLIPGAGVTTISDQNLELGNFDYVGFRLVTEGGEYVVHLHYIRLTYSEYSKKSDCIDLRNNHRCTKLIEYTNSSDFDGIKYEISPQPTFYLRVPAQLLEDENPQTQEDLELSNGEIVTIRQTIQEKSIFKLGYLTPYLHTKIQKILMHDTVIIDGIQWKRRDAYEAPRIEDYPLKKGEVLLTKYNSVLKNTI